MGLKATLISTELLEKLVKLRMPQNYLANPNMAPNDVPLISVNKAKPLSVSSTPHCTKRQSRGKQPKVKRILPTHIFPHFCQMCVWSNSDARCQASDFKCTSIQLEVLDSFDLLNMFGLNTTWLFLGLELPTPDQN